MRSNSILTGDTFVAPANAVDTKRYREQCLSLHGTTRMPPVLYKGRIIPAGIFGTRDIGEEVF